MELVNNIVVKSLLGIGCLLGMLLVIAMGIVMLFKQVLATGSRVSHDK